jgi:hypothetical protein
MMVQSAPEGEPHFVSTMQDHMSFCGQMARAFGNGCFEPLAPFEEVVYVVENHDRGWDDYDQHPGLDPDTRLPYLMARTPPVDAVKTNRGSPAFNEAHHPYCGLLSSMHTWGLYNRRYGFTQFVVRTRKTISIPVSDENKSMIQSMLDAEVARQARLKQKLSAMSGAYPWGADEKRIVQNYKQLQFFDTLALYFHLSCAAERATETFICVPAGAEQDESVTVRKIDESTYSLDPFPFRSDALELTCGGRYMRPYPAERDPADLARVLQALPADMQKVRLVPA